GDDQPSDDCQKLFVEGAPQEVLSVLLHLPGSVNDAGQGGQVLGREESPEVPASLSRGKRYRPDDRKGLPFRKFPGVLPGHFRRLVLPMEDPPGALLYALG